MLVTLSGIVIEVKLVQDLKASSPMLVTLSGIETEVRLLQERKVAVPNHKFIV
jgi:hypothetical protein